MLAGKTGKVSVESARAREDELHSVHEAAAEAGLEGSEHVVYRMVREGSLSAARMGGTIRIPGSEVARLKRMVEEERDALTAEDVAADLRVSLGVARRMMSSREIPTRRRRFGRGGAFLSPRAEYMEWRRRMLSG